MLNSTRPRSGASTRRRRGHRRRDVPRVGARMHGDPGRAGIDARPARRRAPTAPPAARVAQRRDLVDVDRQLDHQACSSVAVPALTARVARLTTRAISSAQLAISSRPAFEHDAQQRLGARVADQQPALAGEPRFDARRSTSAMAGHRCQIAPLAHADVDQHLRIGHQLAGQRRQLLPVAAIMRSTLKRGAKAIAGEQVVGEDHVARLLAAEREAARAASPPSRTCRRPGERTSAMPRLCQRQLEPDVAHHRGDDRVARAAGLRLQLPRAHQQHGVAVDDPAVLVDEDRAVAVAVEGDAQAIAPASTRARASDSGCVEPQRG